MKRIALLFLPLLFPAASLAAADVPDANVLTLLGAYRLAREHDAVIGAAGAARDAGSEKRIQGRALLLPSLSVSANVAYNDMDVQYSQTGPIFPNGIHRFRSNGAEVTLTQPLYRSSSYAQYEQSKVVSQQAHTQYAAAEQDLILRVAQAYFDVLLSRDSVAFLEAQAAAVQADLARAKREFELGAASVVDEREARARYDAIQAQLIAGRSDLEIRTQALSKLIGRAPRPLASVREPVTLAPPEPQDTAAWEDDAERNSLDVALAREALQIAKDEVDRQRGAKRPTLDLVASYSSANQNDSAFGVGIDSTTKLVGLSMQMPLYAGGGLDSRVREAAANLERAQEECTEVVRRTRLNADAAYLQTMSARAQEAALEQAVESSESSLAATRRGFEVGRRTNLDVLNAEQMLYGARRDRAAAKYAFFISRLRLLAVAGRLSQTDVETVDQLLDHGR
jgi:outer membrane protein